MNVESRPLATDADLVGGNRVRVLVDGPETYRAMFDAIDRAAEQVCVVAYQVDQSDAGRSLGQRLADAAARGVSVRLLVDAFGSLTTSDAFLADLEENGIAVRRFNPVAAMANGADVNHRNHRKLMVVDDRVSFTGGINFAEGYCRSEVTGETLAGSGNDPAAPPWRDTHLRIEGPVIAQFIAEFVADWNSAGDDGDDDLTLPTTIEPAGDDSVRIATSDAGDEGRSQTIYETYLRAFLKARTRVWITQAYFAPDERFLDVLLRTARDGVDVRLVLPARSDSRLMVAAARSYYSALLEAGVRLFERHDVLLHAKTALIDDYWITIGSSNLDQRSIAYNRELNAVAVSDEAARALEDLFELDIARSTEIRLDSWRNRPLYSRLLQRVARSVRQWL